MARSTCVSANQTASKSSIPDFPLVQLNTNPLASKGLSLYHRY